MHLKVLCNENLPRNIVAFLQTKGLNVVRVTPGTSDSKIALQARREKRIIITFDSDFANILAYPPQDFFGIIRLKVNPPFANVVIGSLQAVFKRFKTQKEFRGKLIIAEPATVRVWES